MNADAAADCFAALGSNQRLEIIQALVRAGDMGMTVGEVQEKTGIAPSTLAHHLKFLVNAELVAQRKAGRSTINAADFTVLEALSAFILQECCADAAEEFTHESHS